MKKKITSIILILIIFFQFFSPLVLAAENDDLYEPLVFENEEFRNKIFDCNGDGKITKYDIENVQYIFNTDYLEYPEYFTNLTNLTFNIKSTSDNYLTEQQKWIEKINKLPNHSNMDSLSFNITLDLGTISYNEDDLIIDLNDYSTIINYCYGTLSSNSLYASKIDLNDTTTPFSWDDGKIIIERDVLGSYNNGYAIYGEYGSNNYSRGFDFIIKWNTIDDGNIPNLTFENEEFKQYLIEQGYDTNNDGELNKPELYNIDHLNSAPYLENPEAFPNLNNIEFNITYSLDNIQEKQTRIKNNIDKLKLQTVKDNLFITNTINLGNRNYSNETLSIDLNNDFSTILSYFSNIGKAELGYSEDNSLMLNDNIVTIGQDSMGTHNFGITLPVTMYAEGQNLTNYVYFIIKWNTIDDGNIPNLTFENEKFKQYLIEQGYDTNNDGEINKPEIQAITYMFDAPEIEYPEYFENLRYISIELNCTVENAISEQEKLMAKLNRIANKNCEKSYSKIYIEINNIEYGEGNYNISLNEYFPTLKQLNVYKDKVFCDYDLEGGKRQLSYHGVYDWNDTLKCDENGFIINKKHLGEYSYKVNYRLKEENEDYSCNSIEFYIDWNIKDNSEIINFADEYLKSDLLGASANNNYDFNNDGNISVNEIKTVKRLYTDYGSNSKLQSLEGLQYASNLEWIEIGLYEGLDFSAIYNLPKLRTAYFLTREDNVKMDDVYSEIPNLTQIKTLIVSFPYATDIKLDDLISNIKNMQLEEFQIPISWYGDTVKLSKFNDLNNIKTLNISKIEIDENINGLNNLENLTIVNRSGYPSQKITDFSNLSKITKLKNLEVTADFDEELNGIDTIQSLSNFTIIADSNNKINTSKLLESLKNLKESKNVNVKAKGNYNLDLGSFPINSPKTIATTDIDNLLNEYIKTDGLFYDASNEIIIIDENKNWLEFANSKALVTDEYGTKNFDITVMEKIDENSAAGTTSFNVSYKVVYNGNKIDEVEIKNQKLKEYLLQNCDIDGNEKITEYDLINIDTLNLFNAGGITIDDFSDFTAMSNLKSLSVYSSNIANLENLQQLNELAITVTSRNYNQYMDIKDIYNKIISLNNLSKIRLSGNFETNLGIVPVNTQKIMNFNDICPLLSAISLNDNIFYMNGARWECNNNTYPDNYSVVTVDNTNKNITLNTGNSGTRVSNLTIKTPNNFNGDYTCVNTTIRLKWTNTVQADQEQEIYIPDVNFKNILLEEYDLDRNEKITEYDLVNLEKLDISNKNISDLTGIEHCINLKEIDANSNNLTSLEPVRNLINIKSFNFTCNKIEDISPLKNWNYLWGSLANNYITDITCLKEFNADELDSIDFRGNYINIEDGSENLNTLNELCDAERFYRLYHLDYCLMHSQKYGSVNERNDILIITDLLKNKLIEYGVDSNNDGDITKGELNDFNQGTNISGEGGLFKHYKMDLSGLNLTSNDITCLKYLNCIDEIDLSNNKITDVSMLQYMKYLYKINLSNNNVNVSTLTNITASTIDLTYNNISNIYGLETIKSLDVGGGWFAGGGDGPRYININLSNNNIKDISNISGLMDKLYKLNLSNNKIEDISILQNYNFDNDENNYYTDIEYDFSNNYIDINSDTTKSIVQTYKNNNIVIKLDNQQTKVEKIDNETGIKIETTIEAVPENVVLEIEQLDTSSELNQNLVEIIDTLPNTTSNTKFKIFDIKLVDNANNEIQPNGRVTVYLPIPNGFSSKVKVYNINPSDNENPYTLLDTTIETIDNQKYAKFTTNHFSYYSMVNGELTGDVNGDGKVNITDVALINSHVKKVNILTGDELIRADVNGDGKVNITDVGLVNSHVKKVKLLW